MPRRPLKSPLAATKTRQEADQNGRNVLICRKKRAVPMSSILARALGMDSHTSTPQWQTFETRMRQRHAERCLLQARTALESGSLDVARAALEEARSHSPEDPEIDILSELLVARLRGTVPQPRRLTRRATATVALLGLGLACVAVLAVPETGPAIVRLAGMATSALAHIVHMATAAGIPQ